MEIGRDNQTLLLPMLLLLKLLLLIVLMLLLIVFIDVVVECSDHYCWKLLLIFPINDVVVGRRLTLLLDVVVDCSDRRRCCCTTLLLLRWRSIRSIKNIKSGVSILIEFLWWSAIIGLLLLLMKYSLAV